MCVTINVRQVRYGVTMCVTINVRQVRYVCYYKRCVRYAMCVTINVSSGTVCVLL